jgi:hypothetical protein
MNPTLTNAEAVWMDSPEGRFWTRWRDRTPPELTPIRQHKFHDKRKWMFDFYWGPWASSSPLAVEIVGLSGRGKYGQRTVGRHQTRQGMIADFEKHNAAVEMGIAVLYVPTSAIDDPKTYEMVERVLLGRRR